MCKPPYLSSKAPCRKLAEFQFFLNYMQMQLITDLMQMLPKYQIGHTSGYL